MNSLFKIGCYICICLLFASCNKENVDPNKQLEDGISTIISDLAGDVEAHVGSGGTGGEVKEQRDFHTFLFRFSDQKQTWLKTAADSSTSFAKKDWDLAFSNQYNSMLYVNDGTMKGNPAYGNGSKHKVLLVRKNYDQVLTAPTDAEFDSSSINAFGMITDEYSQGWFNYDLTSHLVKVMPGLTYVIRLSNGKYAKLQMINVYKGNPPAVTDITWAAPYFTFKYFVQEDGSKNLKTK
ncbi:HmuY family protein [Sphingobacterium faecium]|uniref:HmuY family protein n=1 Tax=Sphingobacterium faecium TaxID=34087 RepID=UPI00246893FD|nr:HmuY family protein [Sphingobacterium faecium]MDH5826181.1 HmuY family protein [Sphingobacterium faecium]